MTGASNAMNDEARMTNDREAALSAADADRIRHSKFVIPLMAWVAAGFLFLAILWTAMFTAARSADTRTVPLATQGGRP